LRRLAEAVPTTAAVLNVVKPPPVVGVVAVPSTCGPTTATCTTPAPSYARAVASPGAVAWATAATLIAPLLVTPTVALPPEAAATWTTPTPAEPIAKASKAASVWVVPTPMVRLPPTAEAAARTEIVPSLVSDAEALPTTVVVPPPVVGVVKLPAAAATWPRPVLA
jgi:hypothetical protein